MLNDRVTQLLDTLHASNQEIARCGDCTPSNISRLKSGARKPDPLSPTIDRLINGAIHYATLHNKMELIFELVGEGENESEILENRIRKWLYQDEPAVETSSLYDSKDTAPYSAFGKKFSSAIELSEMTGSQIAHQLNVDPSLISRFLSGTRSPKSNPAMYDQLCQALFNKVIALDKRRELINLIQLAPPYGQSKTIDYSDEILYRHFHAWLYDFKNEDYLAIHHLLSYIETFTLPPISALPEPPRELINQIMAEASDNYMGTKGLQNAVIRFLNLAITQNAKELLLYSDQDINWMINDPDFNRTWAFLMAACATQGTKIKIIHNIERNIKEMTEAIEAWLPLYMAGTIEPYYCNRKNGDRFSHTFFICPGVGAITACLVKGTEETGVYYFCTDEDDLKQYEKSFEALLNNCDSLAKIKPGISQKKPASEKASAADHAQRLNIQNIRLEIAPDYVNVIKENDPDITFTFLHPLMCEAFDSYVQSIHP